MIQYDMKQKLAAVLAMAMLSGLAAPSVVAEGMTTEAAVVEAAVVEAAQQYTKIQASAEAAGNTIIVYAKGMSNPVICATLDGVMTQNMNGTSCTFMNVENGVHTVQVRYNAPDASAFASDVLTVTVNAEPVVEPVIEPIVEPVIEPVVEPVIEPAVEPVIEPAVEPVIEPVVEPVIEPVVEPVIEPVIEPAVEPVIEPVIEPAADPAVQPDGNGDSRGTEPVYSKISAQVVAGTDTITVTITDGSDEAMYVAVGDDFKEDVHKGDSVIFSGLAAGKYDIEVDYLNGSNVFRTSATVGQPSSDSDGSSGGSGTGSGTGGDTTVPGTPLVPSQPSTPEGSTLPEGPEGSGAGKDEVKAFTIRPIVTAADGSISVEIDGASSREIDVSLLDASGKEMADAAIIGNGLVNLGRFSSGTYTVRAQYVTPVQKPDGSYDFKAVEETAVVPEGVKADPEEAQPISIQARVETGKDYVIVTVTESADKQMYVALGELEPRMISKGGSVRFDGLTPGKSYDIEIDYVDPIQGASPYRSSVAVPEEPKLAAICITAVTGGENKLTVTGTAQAGTQILVCAEPSSAKAEVLTVASDGRFSVDLVAQPGTYTKVTAYYVMDGSSAVSANGAWTVTAPAVKPTLVVDPVDINSTKVVAKTAAGVVVTLTTRDSVQTLTADSEGIVRFTLAHTYLKNDTFTLTVVYGPGSGQSFTEQVTVGGIANYNDLEYGDTGDDVVRLTTRLQELGYPVTATSRYGSTVREAVRLFQMANGLKADGRAGDTMQAALYSVGAIAYGSDKYPTLVRGDKGLALIYTLQQRLKDLGYYTIKVDGIFGSGTQRAVRLFQKVNGLPETGKADNATQTLLYSSAAKPADSSVTGEYKTLSRSGKYNSDVVPMQRRLKSLGYYTGNIDGYFGSQTYRAVRNFQSRNGLNVTGVADPYTQEVLYSSYAKAASSSSSGSSSSTGYRLLYWGCRGDAVKRLQNALIDAGYKSIVRAADGIYGQWTYDAVKAYQKDHGLYVDGVAGKNTQNSLYGTHY